MAAEQKELASSPRDGSRPKVEVGPGAPLAPRRWRWAWTAGGAIFLAAALVGVAVPVLPTTPFLLLATACFLRGSARMHRWMLANRWFGDYLRRYREGRGIPLRTKLGAIALLWATIGLSVTFAVESWPVRIGLLAIAVAVTAHIAMIGRRRGNQGVRERA